MIEALTVCDLDCARRSQLIQESIGERTFANAGFAGQEQELTSTRARLVEGARKLVELGRAPNQSAGFWSVHRLHGVTAPVDQVRLHHETIATPVKCLDIARAARIVAKRATQLLDA